MSNIIKQIEIQNIYNENGETLTKIIREWLKEIKCKN